MKPERTHEPHSRLTESANSRATKTAWHRLSSQRLSEGQFVKIVNRILDGRYVVVNLKRVLMDDRTSGQGEHCVGSATVRVSAPVPRL